MPSIIVSSYPVEIAFFRKAANLPADISVVESITPRWLLYRSVSGMLVGRLRYGEADRRFVPTVRMELRLVSGWRCWPVFKT